MKTKHLPFPNHSHSGHWGSLEGNEGNMEPIGGIYEKLEICRKEPVMNMMVEYHAAGFPPREKLLYIAVFSTTWNLYDFLELFQNLISPGYVEGMDHDFKTLTCTIVDLLEEIIQGKLFKQNYSIT